jgi:hypothetical protein
MRQPGVLFAGVFHASSMAIELVYWRRSVCAAIFSGRIMILNIFSTSKVTEFAKGLAQDIGKRYPPAIANNPAQMVSQKRLTGILEETFLRATEFNRENKLGWYKKAKLGNEFKWELKEMGYDEKFVDVATEGLIVYLTRGATPKV